MNFNPDLVKGSTALVVLRLLAEREMYGYEIVKVVNERTNGAFEWKEGTLYPCLHGLEADGLVKAIWREAANGRRRKYYRITRQGQKELAARTAEWQTFAGNITALLAPA